MRTGGEYLLHYGSFSSITQTEINKTRASDFARCNQLIKAILLLQTLNQGLSELARVELPSLRELEGDIACDIAMINGLRAL